MNKTGLINETYAFDTDDLQMHLVDSRQEGIVQLKQLAIKETKVLQEKLDNIEVKVVPIINVQEEDVKPFEPKDCVFQTFEDSIEQKTATRIQSINLVKAMVRKRKFTPK